MNITINVPKERINGNKITLTTMELININQQYLSESLREFIEFNHSDWSKDKIDYVSSRAFELFDNIERGEDEQLCIKEAEKEWEEKNYARV